MKYTCPECGGKLVVSVENTILYSVENDGKLKRDGSNHAPTLHCINNKKHRLDSNLRNLLIKHLAGE